MSALDLVIDAVVPSTSLTMPAEPRAAAIDAVVEWLRHVDVQIPKPDPIALRWVGGRTVQIPVAETIEDEDLVIEPDWPDITDLAHAVVSIVEEHTRSFPGPLSWRRWELTGRLSKWLYVTGITGSGGCIRWEGMDPHRRPIYDLPGRAALHHRRYYILWKPLWWWECHARQRWTLRGRHWPAEPYTADICARCLPCWSCGNPYACKADCETLEHHQEDA